MIEKSNIIMITVCAYCNRITKAKNVYVDQLSSSDIEKGFQVSHGICVECHSKEMEEIRLLKEAKNG